MLSSRIHSTEKLAHAYTYSLVSRTQNTDVNVEDLDHAKKDLTSYAIARITYLESKGHLLSCSFGRKKQLPMYFGQSELGVH